MVHQERQLRHSHQSMHIGEKKLPFATRQATDEELTTNQNIIQYTGVNVTTVQCSHEWSLLLQFSFKL
jgi:hypothetical protein